MTTNVDNDAEMEGLNSNDDGYNDVPLGQRVTFEPPEVVDVDTDSHDENRRVGFVLGNRTEPEYATVDNPAMSWVQTQKKHSLTWAKVLGVMSVALFIDVVILTVYVYNDTEPRGYAEDHFPNVTRTVPEDLEWMPLPDYGETLTKIAFGSCASQYMPQPYWDTLATQYEPDLLVLMGDNVYGDCSNSSCLELHQAYHDLGRHPSFRGGHAVLPVIATLDDHDYGQKDCHADNPHKEIAKELFYQFFDIPERFRRETEGVYQSYAWGPPHRRVQVILLDTRYSRSPFEESKERGRPYKSTTDTSTQMLSAEQWSWLRNELETNTAQVRIIVSSIQVLSSTGFESWGQLPHELHHLETLIRPYLKTSAVLLLSGDRHMGAMYEKDGLVEVTASSWTHSVPLGTFADCNTPSECDEPDGFRMGDMVRTNNFGSLDIDWEAKQIRVSLRNAEGTAWYRYHETGDQKTDAGSIVQTHTFYIP